MGVATPCLFIVIPSNIIIKTFTSTISNHIFDDCPVFCTEYQSLLNSQKKICFPVSVSSYHNFRKTGWQFDNLRILERFSIECVETKTEMISTANHRPKKNITRSQSVIGEKTRDMLEARENSDDKVAIDLSFTSDWSKGLRKISRPMKRQMKGEPIQS